MFKCEKMRENILYKGKRRNKHERTATILKKEKSLLNAISKIVRTACVFKKEKYLKS